jgi:O-antigen/teichoic acid export membrane protein
MRGNVITILRQRLNAARGNSLVRSSLALMTGSIFAQVVFLLSSPVLTRVFGFADFGGLANYNAWVSILALLGSLRYDHAIIVAKDDESARRVILLAAALTFASSGIYAVIGAVIQSRPAEQGYLRDILGIVLLIPVGVLVANLSSILVQLSVRAGLFQSLAIIAGVQAIVGVAIQITLGMLGVDSGLIIGTLVGSVVYGVILAGLLWRDGALAGLRADLAVGNLRRTAREFSNFPRYALGADALGLVTLSFTPVLISALFNPALAGVFAFSIRVVRLPMLVISTAIAGVLRKEGIDQLRRTGSVYSLYKSVVTGLLAVGLVPCIVMLLYGPEIFGVVFGAEWSEAGRVVQILSPGILLEFMAFPLTTLYLITDRQRITLKLQLLGTSLLFGAIVFGSVALEDFMATCFLISGVMVIVNLASIALAGHVSRTHREIASQPRAEAGDE